MEAAPDSQFDPLEWKRSGPGTRFCAERRHLKIIGNSRLSTPGDCGHAAADVGFAAARSSLSAVAPASVAP